MFKLFGREQVVYLGVIAAVAQVLVAYNVDVSGAFQGWATAVVVFVFAVGNAIKMHDGAIALATGLFNAAVALFAAFGLDMSPTNQSLWVGLATVLIAAFTRQQVVNPVPAGISPAGRLVAPGNPPVQ
jgi:hypothetical protein